MHSERDPIVAIATAPGRGGIGIVRVSGGQLAVLLPELLGAKRAAVLQPRRASLGPFLAADGAPIDEGIALWFPAPVTWSAVCSADLRHVVAGPDQRQSRSKLPAGRGAIRKQKPFS